MFITPVGIGVVLRKLSIMCKMGVCQLINDVENIIDVSGQSPIVRKWF